MLFSWAQLRIISRSFKRSLLWILSFSEFKGFMFFKFQQRLFLLGHSLGSSLCMIFAAALHNQHEDFASRIASVYTFGMPRVGNQEFAQKMEGLYKEKCFRITHAADIIPLVSLCILQYISTFTFD